MRLARMSTHPASLLPNAAHSDSTSGFAGVLALGGAPGKLYERPEPFRLGAADPAAT